MFTKILSKSVVSLKNVTEATFRSNKILQPRFQVSLPNLSRHSDSSRRGGLDRSIYQEIWRKAPSNDTLVGDISSPRAAPSLVVSQEFHPQQKTSPPNENSIAETYGRHQRAVVGARKNLHFPAKINGRP